MATIIFRFLFFNYHKCAVKKGLNFFPPALGRKQHNPLLQMRCNNGTFPLEQQLPVNYIIQINFSTSKKIGGQLQLGLGVGYLCSTINSCLYIVFDRIGWSCNNGDSVSLRKKSLLAHRSPHQSRSWPLLHLCRGTPQLVGSLHPQISPKI